MCRDVYLLPFLLLCILQFILGITSYQYRQILRWNLQQDKPSQGIQRLMLLGDCDYKSSSLWKGVKNFRFLIQLSNFLFLSLKKETGYDFQKDGGH